MILTPHGNLIEVNKLDEYRIEGLLLSTDSNSHPEYFNPWYHYGNSKVYKHHSIYKYIIYPYMIFKTPLNFDNDSVLFFPPSNKHIYDTRISVQYTRIAYKAFYSSSKSY